MKDQVLVNGVPLTRAQVEKALAELNATPEVPNLTRVRMTDGTEGVVIKGGFQKHYAKSMSREGFSILETTVTVVDSGGNGYSYLDDERMLRTWKVK